MAIQSTGSTPDGHVSPGWTGARLAFYAPFAVFVVHTLEEMPGFASWVSSHFAHLTTEKFAVSHIPLILLVLLSSWRASRPKASTGWVVMATAFQWQFAVNAVFHLGTGVTFGEYSPGMVTAATVALPATGFYLVWLRRHRHLTNGQFAGALLLGTAIAGAAIGVLFLG
ncbi:HXXEE domain-containing protein [Amycolatopsis roodepoortensis]|uniref:HXXEE domain-containing protein n=1 Tax=Amycolatopsis roodepoortensis TaxID=700274 RepID=UPI00214CDA9D|nr:HXXEE domain-containing protein [Amycolatopsis roodepoortensis]UUV35891.1 HXXEE domain-containing protein [Amycolatopsis roodepoortensis]